MVAANAQPPNIVLILADDLGDGDLGCYGQVSVRTPNIDRLAQGGIRFTNAFATTASCSPSRVSLFSGRYPQASGAPDLHDPLPRTSSFFPDNLRYLGHHTMHAGKLHLGEDTEARFSSHNAVPGRAVDLNPDLWARLLVDRPQDQPFFLSIGFFDPHRPLQENPPSYEIFPEDITVPPYLIDCPETRADLALYFSHIMRLDQNVGLVLKMLEEQQVLNSTLIVFSSDNGMPFPRAKSTCYDSGVRIPLIIHYPESIPGGQVSSALVSLVDLAPTFVALGGGNTDPQFQGVSLLPIFVDPSSRVRSHVFLQRNWHNFHDAQRGSRDERYKYIRHPFPAEPLPQSADIITSPSWASLLRHRDLNRIDARQSRLFMVPRPSEELYDTLLDPYEFVNLAAEPAYQEILQYMRQATDEWLHRTGERPPAPPKAADFDVIKRTRMTPKQ